MDNYGVDWDGPVPAHIGEAPVPAHIGEAPVTISPLNMQELRELQERIDLLRHSLYQGVDIYVHAVKSMLGLHIVCCNSYFEISVCYL